MFKRSRCFVASLALLCLSAAALEKQPAVDYRARREKLAQMTNGGVVVLFAATEAEGPNALYGFRQENNFYYLTGWEEPGAAVVIAPARPARGNAPAQPYTEILLLPGRNLSQEAWTGPKLTADSPDAKKLTGFDRVEPIDKLRDELVRVLPSPFAAVYSDLPGFGEQSTAPEPLRWLARANAFPNYVGYEDVKPLLASLRTVKDAGEVGLIRKATDASMEAHRAVLGFLKPGVTEREIQALMQYEFMRRGCERPGYAPIVGAGVNGTVLHYSENEGAVRDGDLVVMDVGGEYSMYVTDITRTLPANGKFTPRQRELYNVVLGAHQAAVAAFRANQSTLSRNSKDSLYRVAYDYINSHGKDLHGQPLGKYFIHGLSHFVGLDVHDVGNGGEPIKPGSVFTIEPGIYLTEEKIGIRIEDTFWVAPDGKLVNLSEKLPKTVEEIEAAMQK